MKDRSATSQPIQADVHSRQADVSQQVMGEVLCESGIMLELRRRLEQGGAHRGEIMISLLWDSPDTLDLHMVLPENDDISFRKTDAAKAGSALAGPLQPM